MKLKEINSLVELFFKKYEEKFPKEIKGMKSHEETFLVSLKKKIYQIRILDRLHIHGSNIGIKIKILSNYLVKIFLRVIDVFYYQKIDQNG